MKTTQIRKGKRNERSDTRILTQGAPRTEVKELLNGFEWSAKPFGWWNTIFVAIPFLGSLTFGIVASQSPMPDGLPLCFIFFGLSLLGLLGIIHSLTSRYEIRLEDGCLTISGTRSLSMFRWEKKLRLKEVKKLGMGPDKATRMRRDTSLFFRPFFFGYSNPEVYDFKYLRIYTKGKVVDVGHNLNTRQLQFALIYLGRQFKEYRNQEEG